MIRWLANEVICAKFPASCAGAQAVERAHPGRHEGIHSPPSEPDLDPCGLGVGRGCKRHLHEVCQNLSFNIKYLHVELVQNPVGL